MTHEELTHLTVYAGVEWEVQWTLRPDGKYDINQAGPTPLNNSGRLEEALRWFLYQVDLS